MNPVELSKSQKVFSPISLVFKKNFQYKKYMTFNDNYMKKRKKIILLFYILIMFGSIFDNFEDNSIYAATTGRFIATVLFSLFFLGFIMCLLFKFENSYLRLAKNMVILFKNIIKLYL